MHQQYMLAAVGSNRTGVVAEISEAVFSAGGNIENSFMTLLGEYFSLMIQVSLAGEDAFRELQERCEALRRDRDLAVHVFPLREGDLERSRQARVRPHYDIRVSGEDKAGIVYRISRLLASRGINILQMSTSVESASPHRAPQITMRIQIEVPREMDGESLRRDLGSLADELQKTITLTRRQD
jgi:glycine cleavage system transcriptional repressor